MYTKNMKHESTLAPMNRARVLPVTTGVNGTKVAIAVNAETEAKTKIISPAR